ncbi:hypothetical protein BHM03_00019171 [Ensete ventricosum]|uniref:Uncharacterized protein n=1 Tax=Ensete ventricosum TaxID=4639 RepID=A0A445MFP4_ENSVE|nr:hypothetical protein BHM03_00019171 [Ensete ventricosum]
MHPVRFPNSGIRAKVFVRKISLKLCVMILNRVESFYVLLLCFHSKDNKERGWPATTRPSARVAGNGQAPCRGGQPWPTRMQGRSPTTLQLAAGMAGACRGDACGRRQHPWLGRRGWLPVARLQGAAPRPGLPPARAAPAHACDVQRRRLRRAAAVVATMQ